MSKQEVDREAQRLAKYIEGHTKRSDRVFVMVVRNNIEDMSAYVGVEIVKRPDPVAKERGKPSVIDLEGALGGQGTIELLSERKVLVRKGAKKRAKVKRK